MCVCTCTRWAEIWVHLRIDVRYSISDNFWYYSLEFSSFHFALFPALICERTTFILDEFCNIPHVVHSIESISSAFVIVVWGRNFKYSLSINSKQTLPIENLCILKQPRIPFIFQNTEISLVFTRTLAPLSLLSLSLSRCRPYTCKHIQEKHFHHYVWQLWFEFAWAFESVARNESNGI